MNTPNKITLSRIAMIPIVMIFILGANSIMPSWYNDFMITYGPYLAIFFFLITAITDFLDGHLARKNNQVTVLGKFLDPLADKLLIIAALIALVEKGECGSIVVMIIVAREIIVTGIRIIAVSEGKVIAASIFGKIKTVVQIIAISLFLISDIYSLGIIDNIVLWFAAIITIASGIDYFLKSKDIILQK